MYIVSQLWLFQEFIIYLWLCFVGPGGGKLCWGGSWGLLLWSGPLVFPSLACQSCPGFRLASFQVQEGDSQISQASSCCDQLANSGGEALPPTAIPMLHISLSLMTGVCIHLHVVRETVCERELGRCKPLTALGSWGINWSLHDSCSQLLLI